MPAWISKRNGTRRVCPHIRSADFSAVDSQRSGMSGPTAIGSWGIAPRSPFEATMPLFDGAGSGRLQTLRWNGFLLWQSCFSKGGENGDRSLLEAKAPATWAKSPCGDDKRPKNMKIRRWTSHHWLQLQSPATGLTLRDSPPRSQRGKRGGIGESHAPLLAILCGRLVAWLGWLYLYEDARWA